MNTAIIDDNIVRDKKFTHTRYIYYHYYIITNPSISLFIQSLLREITAADNADINGDIGTQE